MLVKLFSHTLRFKGVLASIERLEDRQRCAHQSVIGENAAEADRPFLGVDRYQRMDTVVGPQLAAPTPFGCGAAQTGAPNFTNFHGMYL
jgi:hypothetical protein